MKIKVKRLSPIEEVPARFYDPERDGVTFSLLTTWKRCRENARLVLQGWTSKKNSLGTVFGSLVHGVNQVMYQDVRDGRLTSLPSEKYIKKVCGKVEKMWRLENPRADKESLEYLEFGMILLEALMPAYFKYWKKDFDLLWAHVEKEFKWPVKIEHPTAKATKTFVRGKIDGAFQKVSGRRKWLFETKTKSNLSERGEGDLADILPHELQVNIYLLYLQYLDKKVPEGLLFNIIRRPGMRQKKHESILKFAQRVAADVRKCPDHYFIRLQMSVSKEDLEKNEGELRDMVSDFLMWWNGLAGHYKNSDACQNKYGTCAFLPVCARRDFSNFYKRDKVFRELADEL